jgi:hypothetical protein
MRLWANWPPRLMLLFAAIASLYALSAWAGNAAWFRWESRIDGRMVCAQSSPGAGWRQLAGPYRDAACSKPR